MGLRFLTAGESHGPALTVILEGLPAGLVVSTDRVNARLKKRQGGYGRGPRMLIESDVIEWSSGLRFGQTTGAPLSFRILNRDWENWKETLAHEGAPAPDRTVERPRPGHADLAGGIKYDRKDLRDVLERASARETASRVAVGAICSEMLATLGIAVLGHVRSIGCVEGPAMVRGLAHALEVVEASDLRCLDPEAEAKMRAEIERATEAKDTLGGTIEIVAEGLMPGLGTHIQWDKRLDGLLAQAIMSIPAVKGVEIGLGFDAARMRGSEVHDPILYDEALKLFVRSSNRAGGIEAGMSNGESLVVRAALKPLSTLRDPLPSIDVRTKESAPASIERSDVCVVPSASIVGEAMVAIVLARAVLEKFGSDSIQELMRNVAGYRAQIQSY